MAYLDPYQRPAPDHFVRRWLFITVCIAALMLLSQFRNRSSNGVLTYRRQAGTFHAVDVDL